MSDTLIAALFSVVAIAILAPLTNHFITKYRERRSLRTSLWVHEFPSSGLRMTYLRDLRYGPTDPASSSRPRFDTSQPRLPFVNARDRPDFRAMAAEHFFQRKRDATWLLIRSPRRLI